VVPLGPGPLEVVEARPQHWSARATERLGQLVAERCLARGGEPVGGNAQPAGAPRQEIGRHLVDHCLSLR